MIFLKRSKDAPRDAAASPKDEASALPEEPVSMARKEKAPAEMSWRTRPRRAGRGADPRLEAEMTKQAGKKAVHEYGGNAPGMAAMPPGFRDETEARPHPPTPRGSEFAEMHPGKLRNPPSRNPVERTYAEDLQNYSSAIAPVADAPQLSPRRLRWSPLWRPHAVSPEGSRARKLTPALLNNRLEMRRKGLLRNPRIAAPSVSADYVAEPCRNLLRTARPALVRASWLPKPDIPSSAELQAEPSQAMKWKKRIIRLEEALSRLNERVVALEQRADDC